MEYAMNGPSNIYHMVCKPLKYFMDKSYDLIISHTGIKTFKLCVIKTKHGNKVHEVLKPQYSKEQPIESLGVIS